MQGGVKVYRGAASAARAYVEADRSRVDDYYLAEGTGLARRFSARSEGSGPHGSVVDLGDLDGDAYERWVAGHDPVTGTPRGRLRADAKAVRFVEVTVNGPKTWSLAAALHPEVAAAYDAAQDRAAEQIIGWVAAHATTRVGPRGRQVQVPVERIEAVTVRHYTSRAGDPHRHLHLQFNARVFAAGQWRGLHTVGFRDSIEALNGIGHAAMATDPELRATLARVGLSLDPVSGEVAELAPYTGRFSARAAQISRHIDRYEADWRAAHPGEEPGPTLRQAWDRRAWKQARPDKVVPADGAELVARWTEELHALGYRPSERPADTPAAGLRPGTLDRDQAVATVLTRLAARRSAWNHADVRGEVERWVAATGLVAAAEVRFDLTEDLTHRALERCQPLLPGDDVPEHVRAWTSPRVLEVEADLVSRMSARTNRPSGLAALRREDAPGLDEAQRTAVAALAGYAELLVLEGPAGAGKTTTLRAAAQAVSERGHRLCVVAPSLKAAEVAGRELGAFATTAAWLVHQHGFRWDDRGHWSRVDAPEPVPEARLRRGDLLLVDEAGMLDQDIAHALFTVADEAGARVALVGDRHQLPAVGRGGVLDLAVRWSDPRWVLRLETVHRFADPEYAELSLAMRTGNPVRSTASGGSGEVRGEGPGEVFDVLLARGQIRLHASEAERCQALAEAAAAAVLSGRTGVLVMADTHDQVAALNGAVRDRLVAAGRVDDQRVVVTDAGERIGVGDRVATRRNDRDLGVANRDTWTVTAVADDGALTLRRGHRESRVVPAAYAWEQVELAYATTVYGAQGETSHTGHVVLGEHTSAASAYVGMTRGRHDNVAHLVTDDLDDARRQWQEVFSRDRADLGPAHAARLAADDIARYGPNRRLHPTLARLRDAWTEEADVLDSLDRWNRYRDLYSRPEMAAPDRVAAIEASIARERARLEVTRTRVQDLLQDPALHGFPPERIHRHREAWQRQREDTQRARREARLRAQQTPRRPEAHLQPRSRSDPGVGL